jgi:hypothetical protein
VTPTLELTRGIWREGTEAGRSASAAAPRLRITARAVESLDAAADVLIGDDAATTLDARFDGTRWLVRGAATLSAAGPVLAVSGAMLASRDLPELFDTTVLLVARPWPDAIREPLPFRPGRRTLVVSAAGAVDGGKTWIDGPLAHLTPDGRVASLVPEGATAAGKGGGTSLTLVPALWEGEQEVVAADIAETSRGALPQRARRCATAHVVALATRHASTDSSLLHASLTLDTLGVREALALALLRPHLGQASVPLYLSSPTADLPAAWRRFAEHTGYALTPTSEGDAPSPARLAASTLATAVPEFLTAALRAAVNSPSDVLPPSLC